MGSYSIAPAIGVELAEALRSGDDTARQAVQRFTSDPWNWSKDKVYRVARAFGFQSGRKRRADKGKILVPGITEERLVIAAKVLAAGTRHRSGKRLIATEDIRQQLALNGHEGFENISISTLNRLLRNRNLGHEDLMAGTPAIEMRAEYPNHVHFVDASICVQWDLRGGKKLVRRDTQKAFYKNKPGYWKEVRKVLVRWVVVDGCSGAFFVVYTYASGENKKDLMDCLFAAWDVKSYAEKYPLHGVPRIVVMDKGAWNISPEVKRMLDCMGVERSTHAAGAARASGAVETVHGYWERRFEYELLFKLADDLEELNARAWDRMIYLNATAVHERHGKTRSAKWREIRADQVRLLPPVEHCRRVATSNPETRVPDERLRITFPVLGKVEEFQLREPALKQRKVTVKLNPWEPDALIVTTEAGEAVPCRLIEKDRHGYDITAPVWGEGQYRRHADPPAATLRRKLEEDKYAVPGFAIKPTGPLVPAVPFLPVKGTEIPLQALPNAPPVRAEEVPGRLRRDLCMTRFTPVENQRIKQMLGDRDSLSQEEYAALKEKVASEFGINPMPCAVPVRAFARAG